MAKYWVVQVQIPLSRGGFESANSLGQELQAVVGAAGSSGTGFGYRDLDWSFNTEQEANDCEDKILSFLSERVIPTQDDFSDGDPVQVDVSEYGENN